MRSILVKSPLEEDLLRHMSDIAYLRNTTLSRNASQHQTTHIDRPDNMYKAVTTDPKDRAGLSKHIVYMCALSAILHLQKQFHFFPSIYELM